MLSGRNTRLAQVKDWLRHVRPALVAAPRSDAQLFATLVEIETRLANLVRRLDGDPIRGRWNEASTPSIIAKARRVARGHWYTRQPPTTTQTRSMALARKDYSILAKDMDTLLHTDLPQFESALETAGATWTPGRKRK